MPYITLPRRNTIPATKIYYEVEISDAPNDVTKEELNLIKFVGKNKKPAMLMLPGGPGGSLNSYASIRKDLAKSADLILFDPRGSGESDVSEAQFCTLDTHIDDIKVFLSSIGVVKPILFGASYGSMSALAFAIKYPYDLSKLICIAGCARMNFLLARENLVKYNATSDQLFWADRLFNGDISKPEEIGEFYKHLTPMYYFDKEKIPPSKAKKTDTTHIFNAAFGKGGFLTETIFDLRSELHNIKVPTKLIFGRQDWINPKEQAEEIMEYISKDEAPVELTVIEDCGHFMWVEQYDKFVSTVTAYIEDK
jgi:proline iminopeptidase